MNIKSCTYLLLFSALLFCAGCGDPDKGAEKYQLDLEKFKKIDPALLLYKETENIIPNIDDPTAIAVDVEDNIYIAGKSELKIFDKERKEKATIKLTAIPTCIAVDKDNRLFIGTKNYIIAYDPEKELDARFSGWEKLEPKTIITSIAVTDDDVFAADAGTRTVWRFAKSGEIINRINGEDKTSGQKGFVVPSPYFDVATDSNEELWIVNPGRQKVQNYRKTGELVSSWGSSSVRIDGFCGCCNPSHIAIMPSGSFVTSEKGLVRVKVYDSAGKFTGAVAGPESFEDSTRGLDLAVDSKGKILILDPVREMVRIFEKKGGN